MIGLVILILIISFVFALLNLSLSLNIKKKQHSNETKTDETESTIEGFTSSMCPDILKYKGDKIHLYNSKVVKVPGANPVIFDNLEDYIQYLKWQRSRNVKCPVLLLQKMYDAQGNLKIQDGNEINKNDTRFKQKISRQYDSLIVDATRNNDIYNRNSYPSYDQTPYYVGVKTPLDLINNNIKNSDKSLSAMESNWVGGVKTVDSREMGKYLMNKDLLLSTDADIKMADTTMKVIDN
jgi:hypothetical protein